MWGLGVSELRFWGIFWGGGGGGERNGHIREGSVNWE